MGVKFYIIAKPRQRMTKADMESLIADEEGETVCNRRHLWHCR